MSGRGGTRATIMTTRRTLSGMGDAARGLSVFVTRADIQAYVTGRFPRSIGVVHASISSPLEILGGPIVDPPPESVTLSRRVDLIEDGFPVDDVITFKVTSALVEGMKNLLTFVAAKALVMFNSEGITVIDKITPPVAYIHLRIHSTDLEPYRIKDDETYILDISISEFYNHLKTMVNGTVCMKDQEKMRVLRFNLRSRSVSMRISGPIGEMPIDDIPSEDDFHTILHIPGTELKAIMPPLPRQTGWRYARFHMERTHLILTARRARGDVVINVPRVFDSPAAGAVYLERYGFTHMFRGEFELRDLTTVNRILGRRSVELHIGNNGYVYIYIAYTALSHFKLYIPYSPVEAAETREVAEASADIDSIISGIADTIGSDVGHDVSGTGLLGSIDDDDDETGDTRSILDMMHGGEVNEGIYEGF